MFVRFFCALLPFVFVEITGSINRQFVVVNTIYGKIRGVESLAVDGRKVHSFLGVPFARPPIGPFRFAPPRPMTPWRGTVKDALEPATACEQPRDEYNRSFWGSEMWNANTATSEDCLYMNIWAPTNAINLSVSVWLFGGGFHYGSPSLLLYDGRTLAALGPTVVVNINYRLGAFGFLYLDHSAVPGNMALLDQQMAIRWIRDNAHVFGGNPNKIGLFGESAGASSIVAHLIAPKSRGLFSNGILQSGTLDNKWAMDRPERALEKSLLFSHTVGCNRSLDISATISCLRKVPTSTLTANLWNIAGLAFLEFPLVIVSRDRNFFRQFDAFAALRNGQMSKDVNIMIGINADEGNFWNVYNLAHYFDVPEQPQLNMHQFRNCVDTAFASHAPVFRDAIAYRYMDRETVHTSSNQPSTYYAEKVNQMVGDHFFTCDSLWLADQMVENDHSAKVFIYYFDQMSSANPWPTWTGVMHGYEIEFVFGLPLYNRTAGYSVAEKRFSRKIQQYWTSFLSDGIPQIKHPYQSIIWPQYTKDNKKWLYLKGNEGIKSSEHRKIRECKMWRDIKDIEYQLYELKYTITIATYMAIFLALLTLVLFLVHLFFISMYVSKLHRRNILIILAITLPVMSLSGICGLCIPRSIAIVEAFSLVFVATYCSSVIIGLFVSFFMSTLFALINLLERLFGGRHEMSETLKAKNVKMSLRATPIGCCCVCLPGVQPTCANIRRIELLVLQAPTVRLLLIIVLLVIRLDNLDTDQPQKFSTYISVVTIISTLIGVYGFSTLAMTSILSPVSQYPIRKIFIIAKVLLILLNIQGAIFGILAQIHVIHSDSMMNAFYWAKIYHHLLLTLEIFLLSVVTTVVLRPRKNMLLDKWQANQVTDPLEEQSKTVNVSTIKIQEFPCSNKSS